jgi:peptidoglycan hydrolase-like protein with peptidoglycan-binding domain
MSKLRSFWKSVPPPASANPQLPQPPRGEPKQPGQGGGKVADMQRSLKAAGYDPGPFDGIIGPKTKAAVKKFQQAKGLAVDGIAGPKTKAALSQPPPHRPAGVVLQSITISPRKPTIISGKQQRFNATGDYSDGSEKEVTSLVEWRVAAPEILANILAINKHELAATGAKCGSTTLTATDRASGVRAAVEVTVAPPGLTVLESITIQPRNPTMHSDKPLQFTATGVYSDGSRRDLTQVVHWSGSFDDILELDPHGLVRPGNYCGLASVCAIDLDSGVVDDVDVIVAVDGKPRSPRELP